MTPRIAVLLAVLGLAGCSAGQGDLSGGVTFRGKPVVYGTVVVIGADGLPCHGAIQPDGHYVVTGIAAGPATVCVTSPPPTDDRGAAGRPRMTDAMRNERDNEDAPGPPVPAEVVQNWHAVPDRYADPALSGLRVVIKRGANTWDIALD